MTCSTQADHSAFLRFPFMSHSCHRYTLPLYNLNFIFQLYTLSLSVLTIHPCMFNW